MLKCSYVDRDSRKTFTRNVLSAVSCKCSGRNCSFRVLTSLESCHTTGDGNAITAIVPSEGERNKRKLKHKHKSGARAAMTEMSAESSDNRSEFKCPELTAIEPVHAMTLGRSTKMEHRDGRDVHNNKIKIAEKVGDAQTHTATRARTNGIQSSVF